MVLLGLGVRDGATPIDGFFQQAHNSPLSSLLLFTDYRTANTLVGAAVLTALYRRLWLLVPLIVVVPYLAVHATELLKPLFGRMKEEGLAYPSGHTTAIIAVLGMLVLAAGARRWVIIAAVVFAVLGMVGQAVTYHYFTDTLGGLLLSTSLVCLAAVALRRLR
jgi:membrane-associated phospholipid phosphatase